MTRTCTASTPDAEKIFCECGMHNDPTKAMITCDEVGGCRHPWSRGWYHYTCIGMSPEQGEEMIENDIPWICRYCISTTKSFDSAKHN